MKANIEVLHDPRKSNVSAGERERVWKELTASTRKTKMSERVPLIDKHFDDGGDEVYSEYSSLARSACSRDFE